MPFTAGVFTPTIIGAAKINELELLATSRITELQREIVAGAAILNNQDPNIVTTGFGESCMNADIYTLRSASTDKGNKTIACEVGEGPEAGSEKISLTKEILTNLETFYIKDNLCANAVEFGTQLGYLLLKAKTNLEVKLSQGLVGLANTNADTPLAAWFETVGVVSGTTYQIQKQNFTSEVLADALWASRATDMVAPIILNGRNLFNKAVLAEFESAGCCTTNAALATDRMFQLYWDAKNVDQVTTKNSTFVIDRNALLFWSSPVYSNLGIASAMTDGKEANDVYHFVDTLPRLTYFANGAQQPIYVDVRMQRTCVKGVDDLVPIDAWKFELWVSGAMTANLENQNALQGIIHIEQVANL
jgi:hypothetical protein